jgi:subtilisin family serine protease
MNGDLPRGRWLLLCWMAAVLLSLLAGPASVFAAPAAPDFASPTILVRFDPDSGPGQRSDVLESVGGEIGRAYELVPGLRLVELPDGANPGAARRRLAEMPGVDFASADAVMQIDRTPNDPLLASQWGITAIRAPLAWDFTTGSAEVEVAVLDTGMDLDHPDLAGNLWTNAGEIPENGIDDDDNGFIDDVHGWDFVGRDPIPEDDNSHGSHTAGTVGATGDNGIGVAGVAWNVSLVPLKICSSTGRCLTSDAIAALDYAVREEIPISNNSYGFGGSCPAAFGAALQAAGAAGHLFVTSAGNDGRNLDFNAKYPASCPQENVLSVAWLADPTNLSSRSNYGTVGVDLAAPGSQIQSTTPGGNYGAKSGTSMAGPHVAGAAALLKSFEPAWEWQQLKDGLMTSVTPVCGLPVASEGTLNVGAAVSGETIPDQTCPQAPVILTGPAPESGSKVASFTFSGLDGAAFKCRIDSDPPTNCLSPVSYPGITDGAHRFSVTQSEGSGLDSASSSWVWTVDTVAPNAPAVSAAPVSPTTLKTASFTISGESRATLSCSLDDGPVQACSSPYLVSGLGDGPHSLVVFQSDRAGNRSNGTYRGWVVDAVPPAPPVINSGPRQWTNDRSASFTFTGESATTARCQLHLNGTAGSWSSCSSPANLTNLVDGDYRMKISLRDPAGNESAAAQWDWIVDTVAPVPPRVESSPGNTPLAAVEISFSGEAGNTLECQFERPGDPGAWESCTSPFSDASEEDGSYRLQVRQVDPAGNSSASASVSWEVDATSPPVPLIEGGPSGPSGTNQAEFLITGEAGALAECLLEQEGEGTQWTACPVDGSWTGLAEGPKTLRVRLRDGAGNLSDEAVRLWTVDTVPPAPPILVGIPSKPTKSGSFPITLRTETGAGASCRLNDGQWSACGEVLPLQGMADGSHILRAYQVDQAGNRSEETLAQWVVDTKAPSAPTVAGGPGRTSRASGARFGLTGEAEARFECRMDLAPWVSCSTPFITSAVSDGPHRAHFRQVDPAGNYSAATIWSWVIDQVPPVVRAAEINRAGGGRYTLSVQASDTGTGTGRIEVSFAAPPLDPRVDRVISWTRSGRVSVGDRRAPSWVRVVDRAGNRSAWVRPDSRKAKRFGV